MHNLSPSTPCPASSATPPSFPFRPAPFEIVVIRPERNLEVQRQRQQFHIVRIAPSDPFVRLRDRHRVNLPNFPNEIPALANQLEVRAVRGFQTSAMETGDRPSCSRRRKGTIRFSEHSRLCYYSSHL